RCSSLFSSLSRRLSSAPLFPYTTLFRSLVHMPLLPLSFLYRQKTTQMNLNHQMILLMTLSAQLLVQIYPLILFQISLQISFLSRSEEHTSELQSRFDLVCRLLLEKKYYY